VGSPHRIRRAIGGLALAAGCLTAGALGETTLHAEAGYGQATYAFLGDAEPTLTRHLLDLEVGLSRPVAAGGALRLGSSLSLMPVTERTQRNNSYALITFDMLTLEYSGLRPLRARAGLGLVRVCGPVNEIAIGLAATVACDIGPVYVGVKGRTSRFEVDFEPHGVALEPKYKLYYAGLVLGLAGSGD